MNIIKNPKKLIPNLNLQQTLQLFKQNIIEELSHWPQLIKELKNDFQVQIPKTLQTLSEMLEKYENDKKEEKNNNDDDNNNKNNKNNKNNNKNNKNNNNDDEDNDEENNNENIELNTNDIDIASRWSLLTFHSHKSNTINHYKLITHNVICISMLYYLEGIRWHSKGDYFATFRNEKHASSLIIHRFSKFESQIPFNKAIGEIQDIQFHPRKPLIYIALKREIRCFNLQSCQMQEKYTSSQRWISTIALHPMGLNLLAGDIDGRVSWYDMDLSHEPFKTFCYHRNQPCRNVCFHNNINYHLWSTCSDDGKIYIFYCKMFRDVFADPILIPLKILNLTKLLKFDKNDNNNELKNKIFVKHRVLHSLFHPVHPWIFAACSDGVIRLFTAL